jgi:PilZ domain
MTTPSRRSTVRRSFRLPLSIGGKLPALTADVSRGGFQAELPQVFMPGSVIHGYFLVNDSEVHFRGKVEWAEPGNPQLSVFSRIGVCFDEMPNGLEPLFQKAEARPRRVVKRLL